MESKITLGQKGETVACDYLVEKGFKIIERNFRRPWGELDVVAISPDKTLVFVEVKTMKDSGVDSLKPEDQMSASKLIKFKRVAALYAGEHEDLINDKKGWRLDVICLTKKGNNFSINHYENV